MPLRTTIAAAFTAPVLALTLSAAPAEAALQASYTAVCPTYTHLPGRNLAIREPNSNLLGIVMIGLNWGNGRVCVATIKNDRVQRFTFAYVKNVTDGTGPHVDGDNYWEYAGEPCTSPPPEKCSAIHARGDRVYYQGGIAGLTADAYYTWGSQ